jgi:tripartite-type tricarboxylate transporter receptor subunit TctC
MRRLALLVIGLLAALPAGAQTLEPAWPAARPIRLLVGFPAGGSVDLLARIVAERMAAGLGQAIVVENRPGQAATLATEIGARSAPDGYTLMMANIGTMTINPNIGNYILDASDPTYRVGSWPPIFRTPSSTMTPRLARRLRPSAGRTAPCARIAAAGRRSAR